MGHPTTFHIDPDPRELCKLRRLVRDSPLLDDVAPSTIDDVVLTVSELASNAVIAARPSTRVAVEIDRHDDVLVVTVENAGAVRPVVPVALPPVDALRGRGLALASMLSASLITEVRDGRTRMTATFPTTPPDVRPTN